MRPAHRILLLLPLLAACQTAETPPPRQATTLAEWCEQGHKILGFETISGWQKAATFESMKNRGCFGQPQAQAQAQAQAQPQAQTAAAPPRRPSEKMGWTGEFGAKWDLAVEKMCREARAILANPSAYTAEQLKNVRANYADEDCARLFP